MMQIFFFKFNFLKILYKTKISKKLKKLFITLAIINKLWRLSSILFEIKIPWIEKFS